MKRIEIGADLNGIELAQVARVLSTTQELKRFLLICLKARLNFPACITGKNSWCLCQP